PAIQHVAQQLFSGDAECSHDAKSRFSISVTINTPTHHNPLLGHTRGVVFALRWSISIANRGWHEANLPGYGKVVSWQQWPLPRLCLP
ncbi:hypothetical protein TorRG33x02_292170, partial [Trema orientale]